MVVAECFSMRLLITKLPVHGCGFDFRPTLGMQFVTL